MSALNIPEEMIDELKMFVKMQFRKEKCNFNAECETKIMHGLETHELYENSMNTELKAIIEREWSKHWEKHAEKERKCEIESEPNMISNQMYEQQIAELKSTVKSMTLMQQGLMEKFSHLSNSVTMLLEKEENEICQPIVTKVPKKQSGVGKRVSRKMSLMTIKKKLEHHSSVEKWNNLDNSPPLREINVTIPNTADFDCCPLAETSNIAPKPIKKKKKKTISKKKKGGRLHKTFNMSSYVNRNSNNSSNSGNKKKKQIKKQANGYELKKQSYEDTDESRKVNLRFGSRQYCALVPEEIPRGLDAIPEENLKLSYAHGFNGHYAKCRNNLLQREDQLVYNLAGAIVLHDIDDNTQRFFTKHTEDITAIAMHPTLPLMATGQLDEKGVRMPRICVWDLNTLELIREIEGYHKNAIYHLEFSPHTGYLYSCAGDCDNTLLVFNLESKSKKMKPIFEYSPISKGDVYGLVISQNIGAAGKSGDLVDEFITYGAKHLKTWEVKDANNIGMGPTKLKLVGHLVPTTKTSIKKKSKTSIEKAFQTAISIPSSPSTYIVGGNSGVIYLVQYHQVKRRFNAFESCPVTCAVLTENGFLATSLKGDFVRYEEIDSLANKYTESLSGNFNCIENISGTGSAHALQYDQKEKILYVGSHRGQIFSLDFSRGEQSIRGEVIINGHSNEIWGLAVHPERPMFVTAGYDGQINCWDAHTNSPLIEKNIQTNEKFTCLCWSSDAKLLAVGTESSKVYLIDFESFDIVHKEVIPKKFKTSPVEQVGCVCFSPDNTLLAVGHFDSSVYVYDVIQKRRKSYLKSWSKHGNCHKTSACTHVQFSEDGKLFKSFGRDYDIQYWNVYPTTKKVKLHPYLVDFNKIQFVGSPLIAGWDTQGLLQSGMDGTDINTCSVTNIDNEELINEQHNCYKRLLVCGDDFGKVWLHNYPALDPTKSKAFSGHSAFVVDVKWSYDDNKVISIGGGDQAVFVWDRV